MKTRSAIGWVVAAGIMLCSATQTLAHCDSTRGPVIPEGKAALEEGDVTPVLKWVMAEHEEEINAAFSKAVAVRALGPEARDLADLYFLETLVRLHRAGEGAPYTGISDEPPKPIVALADQALADKSAEHLIDRLSAHLAESIREKLSRTVEAKESKDTSVASGRAFVEAYVTHMHYVEGVHAAITSAGGHDH